MQQIWSIEKDMVQMEQTLWQVWSGRFKRPVENPHYIKYVKVTADVEMLVQELS